MDKSKPRRAWRTWLPEGKTVLGFLAFFGVSGGVMVTCTERAYQRAALFMLSGTLQAYSRVDSIRTAKMIKDTVEAAVGPLRSHMDTRFNRMETYLIRVPEVRRQVSQSEQAQIRAERDSLERLRAFPPTP